MCLNKRAVIFSYGVGGHTEQAERLATILKPELNNFKIITISDNCKQPLWSDVHYLTGEIRKKNSNFEILMNTGPFKILLTLLKIKKEYSVSCVISNGPGISVMTSFFFKIFGAKIIHIETWSRFNTRSLTGFIMHLISDKFYVQNKSLCSKYKNAIYSGKL